MTGQPLRVFATVVAMLRLVQISKTPPVELNEHFTTVVAGGRSRRIEPSGHSGWFDPGEQSPGRTIRGFRMVRSVGSREVTRDLIHDGLAARASTLFGSEGSLLRASLVLSKVAQHREWHDAAPLAAGGRHADGIYCWYISGGIDDDNRQTIHERSKSGHTPAPRVQVRGRLRPGSARGARSARRADVQGRLGLVRRARPAGGRAVHAGRPDAATHTATRGVR